MDIKYGKDLKKGDLILIAEQNYLRHAIFARFGKKSSIQHYHIFYVLDCKLHNKLKIWKSYIIRPINLNPIAKINPSELNELEQRDYYEAFDYLKEKGLI